MEDSNPFNDAIAEALQRSANHQAALELAAQLTQKLAAAVKKQTNGVVRVSLVTEARALTLGDVLVNFGIQKTLQVGKDKEDQQVRQYVIASAERENRALWALTFDDEGYPVTIRGPEEAVSITCFTEDDLRDAFITAARHGRVGRKIAALVRGVEESSAREQPTLGTGATASTEADGAAVSRDASVEEGPSSQ
jgi:hypothetical protein